MWVVNDYKLQEVVDIWELELCVHTFCAEWTLIKFQ